MAHRHGLAGQFGKREAKRRLRHSVFLFAIGVAVLLVLCGFAAGYSLSPAQSAVLSLALIPLSVLGWFGLKKLDAYTDEVAKDRIKYLRGGQAEALVAWILERELGDDWHVFNGIQLESQSDTDHVVVGPGGVFCISTKSHRGWFVGLPDGAGMGLLWNNKPCPFARDALRQASALAERLKAILGNDVPWVQAILALPFGYVDNDALGDKVWLAHADTLSDRIAQAHPPKSARRLPAAQIERIVKAIEMVAANAAAVYQRPPSASPAKVPK